MRHIPEAASRDSIFTSIQDERRIDDAFRAIFSGKRT